jgi:tetratricopeptide (TPR) repeat protein
MRKSFKLATALLIGAALVAGVNFVASGSAFADDKPKEAKPTTSREAGKPLKAAQDDIAAKKYQDALTELHKVEALPKKTPYDEYALYKLMGFCQLKTGDQAGAIKSFEAVLGSQYMEQSEVPQFTTTLAQLYYQNKNYDKSIEYGTKAIKGGFADENMLTLVSQAYYIKGDYKGALKFTEGLVDMQIKEGKTPKEPQLSLILGSCVKLNDNACQTRAMEKLVTYYPKQEYWENLVYTLLQSKEANSEKTLLDVYRLASEVDVLKHGDQYTEMAQLAIEAGSPGEAVQVLDKGFAKNIFADQREKDKNQRLLESAKKQSAIDQASLAKLEQEAGVAKTGDRDVALGVAFLGYQQYDKATEALKRGLMKGGVKNEPEARLLLGIAQLKAGHKDEASQSFHQVKGDSTLERLANLWTLHAHQA